MELEEQQDEIIVGFNDEAEKIINRLQLDKTSDLDIVSIIGMPGCGKTVLAEMVYNHTSVKSQFYIRAWCCVSQDYRKRRVLLDLLRDMTMEEENPSFDELKDNQLGEALFKSLYDKRYLLVLDDISNIKVWNDLQPYFPNNKNGSRILLTSRIGSVALEAKPDSEPHVLRLLTISESYELLKRKLFQTGDCPLDVQDVLMKIASDCKGLPHVVQHSSGILATMEKEHWEDFEERLSSTMISSSNFPELRYKSLPHHLKLCLLYFGSFLPDKEILVSQLVWPWIADGFVQSPPPNNNGVIS